MYYKMSYMLFFICLLVIKCDSQQFLIRNNFNKMTEVFSWKQITLDMDGVFYLRDSNYERKPNGFYFEEEVEDNEKFFIQYNNVPVGFAVDVDRNRVFITVPKRNYGIPSTLNYVDLSADPQPKLKAYPNAEKSQELISLYRPRIDSCNRLWVVDTGLWEIPNNRQQKRQPAIIIFDLKTDKQILKHELDASVLTNDKTSGGLTSITVDVTETTCDDAFAYINDLATESMIVYSLRDNESWKIQHATFGYDLGATNFTVADHQITWKDGLFSIALTEPNEAGSRRAYYHPFVATQEFSISTDVLKSKTERFDKNFKLEGVRGAWSQSGSHDYHAGTQTLFYANVAQDAILCWNVNKPLRSSNVGIAAQDHAKLVYISDLKIVGDDVWVLVNQMPKYIYGKLHYDNFNFFLFRGKAKDLVAGTVCE